MNSQTKPMMASGLGLATAAAMVAGAVALPITHSVANVPMPSISSAFTLLGHDDDWDDDHGHGNWSNWSGSSSSNVPALSSSYDDDDDDDHEGHHHKGFGNIFGMIGNFLTNNQAEVEAFAAGVPTFYLGPVQLGQGVLAAAFYSGYNGSAAGLPGVLAYVTSQIGDVRAFVKNMVLTVTQLIPSIPLGPVWVGGGRLATAFFDGYNGSAVGLAGIISYVTASLGLQTPPATPAAAVTANKTAAPSAAAVSLPRAAAATVTVGTPKAAAGRAKSAAAAPRAAKAAAAAKSAPKAAAASKRAK
ncbi:MAG: hypothetical protein FGM50_09625 [Mycobacterium sp.]|nr:hypothetical protein [Mycobacterium sp.]